ncbi:hypothetical protein LTR08_001703 [Meristemomyces frigidus]|nr:hypothetical protein LTR08_001703 [Meristemomyces frigidus]
MSKPGDKLLAFSGVAQVYADLLKDEYLAGLWGSRLVLELLWRKKWNHDCSLDLRNRPSQYRAPSWSWASIDGAVEWARTFKEEDVVAKVLGYNVDLVAKAALYGAVKGGRVTLQGHLISALWRNGSR